MVMVIDPTKYYPKSKHKNTLGFKVEPLKQMKVSGGGGSGGYVSEVETSHETVGYRVIITHRPPNSYKDEVIETNDYNLNIENPDLIAEARQKTGLKRGCGGQDKLPKRSDDWSEFDMKEYGFLCGALICFARITCIPWWLCCCFANSAIKKRYWEIYGEACRLRGDQISKASAARMEAIDNRIDSAKQQSGSTGGPIEKQSHEQIILMQQEQMRKMQEQMNQMQAHLMQAQPIASGGAPVTLQYRAPEGQSMRNDGLPSTTNLRPSAPPSMY